MRRYFLPFRLCTQEQGVREGSLHDNEGRKSACLSLGEEAQAGHLGSRMTWRGRGDSEDCAFKDGFCVFCGGETWKLG